MRPWVSQRLEVLLSMSEVGHEIVKARMEYNGKFYDIVCVAHVDRYQLDVKYVADHVEAVRTPNKACNGYLYPFNVCVEAMSYGNAKKIWGRDDVDNQSPHIAHAAKDRKSLSVPTGSSIYLSSPCFRTTSNRTVPEKSA